MDNNKLLLCLLVSSFRLGSCLKDVEIFNPDISYGYLSDIEKNSCRTVKIGDQVWMAENLRTTRYNDGSEVFHAAEASDWSGREGCYCWYNNDAGACKEKYGALYN